MESQNSGQQSLAQHSSLVGQNPLYYLTLNGVEQYLRNLGKPLGSMNLDELLENVWTAEAMRGSTSSDSFQRQASLTLARALSGKTVDQIWKEIQQGRRRRYGGVITVHGGEQTLGEVTLEDFLVQAGLFADESLGQSMELDSFEISSPQSLPSQLSLSPSPSLGKVPTGRKWGPEENDKRMERKLKRKIKNRESAARSRARKQAYHNELVSKISYLENINRMLKREKEFDMMVSSEAMQEPKCQLRRTSSAFF